MKKIDEIPAQLNLARLLVAIRQSEHTVRSTLARSLHLSFATVSNLYKVLEEHGYIRSDSLRKSSGGRRAAEITFNPTARYSVALHIEHHLGIRLALLDLSNNVLEEIVIQPSASPSVDDLIAELATKLQAQLERHGIDPSLLIGAGVAIPGMFNRTTGVVQATTSPVLANLNLKDRLERELGCPVYIHNDADMAALAFNIEHSQDARNILLIYFTVGIGLGIVADGDVYTGEAGFAGELGHTRWGCPLESGSPSSGTELKSIISAQSLLAEYHGKPIDDMEFHANWQPLMTELRDQYSSGERRAVELLRERGRFLGQVVGTLADLFDPGVVALGGHIDPILPIWLPIIRERARETSFYAQNRDLVIRDAPNLEKLILTGCGEAAFQEWIKTSNIVEPAP